MYCLRDIVYNQEYRLSNAEMSLSKIKKIVLRNFQFFCQIFERTKVIIVINIKKDINKYFEFLFVKLRLFVRYIVSAPRKGSYLCTMSMVVDNDENQQTMPLSKDFGMTQGE